MKVISVFLFILISMPAFIVDAKVCNKGQPCGNSCISWKKTCRIGSTPKSSNTLSSHSYKNKGKAETQKWNAAKYIVVASKLNVRDNPFIPNNNIIGTLQKGDEVITHSSVRAWVLISYKSGFGWVNKRYIKVK